MVCQYRCYLAAMATSYIENLLDFKIKSKIYVTDSRVAIAYVKSCASYFSPWESAKIRRIQAVASPASFFHIPREFDTADFGTHFHPTITHADLEAENNTFFSKPKNEWPISEVFPSEEKLPAVLGVYKSLPILGGSDPIPQSPNDRPTIKQAKIFHI